LVKWIIVNFLIMTITNISDFRANARQYIDTVINEDNAVVISRGNSAAVLISLDEYNSIKATERIIMLPNVKTIVDSGIDELLTANTIEVNIDEL